MIANVDSLISGSMGHSWVLPDTFIQELKVAGLYS